MGPVYLCRYGNYITDINHLHSHPSEYYPIAIHVNASYLMQIYQ